ncbi:MAG: ABC transporter ATP-binding protein [Gammaproteobacteria bacterium]|nr:ABC transporter ATP-binding protein [Gammaproteobacteria bacterium]
MLALDIQDLRKTYKNKVEALRGVSLQVQRGDFFALLGPNGAGKSTLIGILSSLVNASSGKVTICGHDLYRDRARAMASIGLVPQEVNFNQFEKPIDIVVQQAGYYGIPRSEALPRAERYLKQLSLWDKRDKISRSLSGGMKRRLMIARAMVNEPQLLILDEPTAGVDIEIRRSMWTFLRQINEQGTTVILTTHYLEEAEEMCRNIAIIDQGQIIENTDVKTLLSKLDVETFVLDMRAPIQQLPQAEGMIFKRRDELTLEAAIPKGTSINRLFEVLAIAAIEVNSMRNKSNRLEELFMRLVDKNEPHTQGSPPRSKAAAAVSSASAGTQKTAHRIRP